MVPSRAGGAAYAADGQADEDHRPGAEGKPLDADLADQVAQGNGQEQGKQLLGFEQVDYGIHDVSFTLPGPDRCHERIQPAVKASACIVYHLIV
jgi:hypothetical protein